MNTTAIVATIPRITHLMTLLSDTAPPCHRVAVAAGKHMHFLFHPEQHHRARAAAVPLSEGAGWRLRPACTRVAALAHELEPPLSGPPAAAAFAQPLVQGPEAGLVLRQPAVAGLHATTLSR